MDESIIRCPCGTSHKFNKSDQHKATCSKLIIRCRHCEQRHERGQALKGNCLSAAGFQRLKFYFVKTKSLAFLKKGCYHNLQLGNYQNSPDRSCIVIPEELALADVFDRDLLESSSSGVQVLEYNNNSFLLTIEFATRA